MGTSARISPRYESGPMPELQRRPHDLAGPSLALPSGSTLEAWLIEAWGESAPGALLVHALDGVIWGWCQGGRLRTAERRPGDPWPLLRWETLTSLRMFSQDTELRVWRDGEGIVHARRLQEIDGERFVAALNRSYVLLGKDVEPRDDAFEVRRSPRGERHAVPRGAARVKVRHSLEVDPQTGLVREAEHRWLGLLDDNDRPLEEMP